MALQLGPVIGAVGGGERTERYQVGMLGSGPGTVHPLITVDAGDGALIQLAGKMPTAPTGSSSRPNAMVGGVVETDPQVAFAAGKSVSGWFTGNVPVSIKTNATAEVWFVGWVYVTKFAPPTIPRYTASGGSTSEVPVPRDVVTTLASHTVTSGGFALPTVTFQGTTSTPLAVSVLWNGVPTLRTSSTGGTFTGEESAVKVGDTITVTATTTSFGSHALSSHSWSLG